jgi:site-specific DNA recombinase
MTPFAIYCRASEEDGDGFSSPPDEQETEARAWAGRAGVEVEESPVFEVVSGSVAAGDRQLGQLIERCESGELAGVIVRDLYRFARDVVAGGAALARLTECGARLVATRNGFDSERLTPETEMMFNILMSVGQAERKRNVARRMFAKDRAAERGVWCAAVPVGYDRDADGRLHPNADAEAVREAFRLRAEGLGFSEIARRLPEVTVTRTRERQRVRARPTRSAVRRMVTNRAYLGEQRVPNGRKGEPRVVTGSHRPLVTEAEWQAANAVRGRAPTHNGYGAERPLHGLVRCGVCGGRLHLMAYGKARDRRRYACTRGRCSVGIPAQVLEPAVDALVDLAIAEGEPHVAAVLEGDDRYERALHAVTEAQEALAEYRDDVELQRVLGVRDFAEGLKVRREAVETARRALREVPRPESSGLPAPPPVTEDGDLGEAYVHYRRALSRRVVAEVRVFPRSAGTRLTLRWHGSNEHLPVATATAQPNAAVAA